MTIAALVAVFGAALLYSSLDPRPVTVRGSETFQIPDGDGWHSFFELEMLEGGVVSVDYAESGDGSVDVFLFREGDYGLYEATGLLLPPLGSMSGSSGAFSVNITGDGTYYLVFTHGSGFESVIQEVEVSYIFAGLRPEGPDVVIARAGFVLVIVAATLGNLGGYLFFRSRSGSRA